MRTISLLIIFQVTLQAVLSAKIVCYYSSWAIYYENPAAAVSPQDLDPFLCTHIMYAFVGVNDDGTLRIEDQNADIDRGGYRNLVALKQQNAELKVLLSIGGGNVSPDLFASIAADPGRRGNMVQSARSFMETYGFDGIDMDWEVPKQADRDNFAQLLQEIKSDFQNNGWLVTAALSSDPQEGYDVPRISGILDFLNIMTYDMYGPWSQYTGQNSALFPSDIESEWERTHLNIDSAIANWKNSGASPDKMIIGIPFYGHTYTLQDPGNNGLHAPFSRPGNPGPYRGGEGSLSYVEFCNTVNSWACQWDDQQKVPICLQGDQWLGTDNVDSIRMKAEHIQNNGLGGAMVWSVDQDDVHGSCGTNQVLLHTINDVL